jgi:hypothetical protein
MGDEAFVQQWMEQRQQARSWKGPNSARGARIGAYVRKLLIF